MKIIITESQLADLSEKLWINLQRGYGANFNFNVEDILKTPKKKVPMKYLIGNQPIEDEQSPIYQKKVDKIIVNYKKVGTLLPLLIFKDDKKYRIIDGHHRWTAAKQLGLKSVICHIIPRKDIKFVHNLGEQTGIGGAIRSVYGKVKKFFGGDDKPAQQTGPVPFSPANLAAELKKQGVKFPDVALAQSMLETGNFTSDIFKENNNLFGMKHPSVRSTVSKGPNRGHASYNNWQDSVKDYKLWQDFYHKYTGSKGQFLAKLNSIYCIPPSCGQNNYARKVQSLLPKSSSLLSA